MGKPLTAAQERIRDAQIEKNAIHLEKVDGILKEIEEFNQLTIQMNNTLVEIYQNLNKAHGMLMQGTYANLYTTHLGAPSGPVFDTFSHISDEFEILSEARKEDFLSSLIPINEYLDKYNYYYSNIKLLFDNINAENSIILRFEAMENLYLELKKLCEDHWIVPIELAQKAVLHNREFIAPVALHGISRQNPFHIQLYLDYSPRLNSGNILKRKLENIRPIIKSINAQLPFAELTDNVPHIQNIVTGTSNNTSIGENVSIGNNNAIGDNSFVKGD